MQVSGSNLLLLDLALDLALAEVHNMIATCPDVVHFADDLAEYEAMQRKLQRFKQRAIDRQIG